MRFIIRYHIFKKNLDCFKTNTDAIRITFSLTLRHLLLIGILIFLKKNFQLGMLMHVHKSYMTIGAQHVL